MSLSDINRSRGGSHIYVKVSFKTCTELLIIIFTSSNVVLGIRTLFIPSLKSEIGLKSLPISSQTLLLNFDNSNRFLLKLLDKVLNGNC